MQRETQIKSPQKPQVVPVWLCTSMTDYASKLSGMSHLRLYLYLLYIPQSYSSRHALHQYVQQGLCPHRACAARYARRCHLPSRFPPRRKAPVAVCRGHRTRHERRTTDSPASSRAKFVPSLHPHTGVGAIEEARRIENVSGGSGLSVVSGKDSSVSFSHELHRWSSDLSIALPTRGHHPLDPP